MKILKIARVDNSKEDDLKKVIGYYEQVKKLCSEISNKADKAIKQEKEDAKKPNSHWPYLNQAASAFQKLSEMKEYF